MTIKEIKDKGLLLFECISGSKAYGLDTATSDTDLKGVFYLPKEQFYGLNYIEQISNDTNDEVYYELGRFVDLLIKNNPNILELLATPDDCILYKHPIMKSLHIDLFLSKICKETFAGYAITQIRKARGFKKKIVNPLPKERKSVLDFSFIIKGYSSVALVDWLEENKLQQEKCGLVNIPHSKGMYAVFYDIDDTKKYNGIIKEKTQDTILLSSIPNGENEIAYLYFNQDAYSIYCKEYREYWSWVEKRNDVRYQGNLEHGKDYDAKNMMHTIRLLQVALEIAETNSIHVKRKNRDELLAIKTGQYEYDTLLKMADDYIEKIEVAYTKSNLQENVNKNEIEKILVQMRNELYQ